MANEIVHRILVVEDELTLANVVKDYFIQAGMDVMVLSSGLEAVKTILTGNFNLVVLDLMLPGVDGLTICHEVRETSDIPVIMVTAKVEEIDRLVGLEMGADDYLCKPFSPRELVARAKAVLRRNSTHLEAIPETANRLTVDAERWVVTLDGVNLELTRREFKLLQILHARPGRVYSRSQLLDLAFPDDSEVIDRTIDSHIKNIRSKMRTISEWDPIRSVYGIGYSYEA